MLSKIFRPWLNWVLVALAAVLVLSCARWKVAGKRLVDKPEVVLRSLRIDDLSLQELTLVADITVRNPNNFGVSLAGLDYELAVGQHPLVRGRKDEPLRVGAGGKTDVSLPFSFTFADVRRALGSLAGRDSAEYVINLGFAFELPVVGKIRVPFTHRGRIPVLRVPEVRLAGIRLKSLSLTSAQFGLRVAVENPNALEFVVNRLQYSLDVAGVKWVTGTAEQVGRVPSHGPGEVELPVTVNLLRLGEGVRDVLTGRRSFPYQLRGEISLGTDLPYFRAVPLAFDVAGEVRIER